MTMAPSDFTWQIRKFDGLIVYRHSFTIGDGFRREIFLNRDVPPQDNFDETAMYYISRVRNYSPMESWVNEIFRLQKNRVTSFSPKKIGELHKTLDPQMMQAITSINRIISIRIYFSRFIVNTVYPLNIPHQTTLKLWVICAHLFIHTQKTQRNSILLHSPSTKFRQPYHAKLIKR